ncbi:MAG TPA: hypothetical protein VM689_04355 [Aliidongia sp.]|nr:hypothetical protein [Aliidongia sp.]
MGEIQGKSPAMNQDLCDEIHALELAQFIEEVQAGEDLVAYLPSRSLTSDRSEALAYIRQLMLNQCGETFNPWGKPLGLVTTALGGFDPLDAFVSTDLRGRSSVWVASDFKGYKRAYQRFWRDRHQLKEAPRIPGNIWHVDHAFNRARITSTLRNRHRWLQERRSVPLGCKPGSADAEMIKQSNVLGYVRLFLVPAEINQSWGRTVEQTRAIAGEEAVTGHRASYMVMAKLIGAAPPVTLEDVRSLAVRLSEVFGIDVPIDDLQYLVGHDTRRLKGVRSLVVTGSADGISLDVRSDAGSLIYRSAKVGLKRWISDVEDLVSYACETGSGLTRPFTPGEANAVRYLLREDSSAVFAAFVHHAMRWPVVRIGEPGYAWYGLITPAGDFADSAGVYSKEEVISLYGLSATSEVTTGGGELLNSVLWLHDRPYAPFGHFWMCWKALPCLPENPFRRVLDEFPSEKSFHERGLCTDDGELVGW